ncbi:hypothetical protein Tco_0071796, partial [Tanacetum coccineum]
LRGQMTEVCQDRIPSVSEFEWQLVDLEKKAKERALQIQWQSLYVCYVKDLVLTMAWLPICGELRSSSYSVHWEPMFILYCQRSISEDYRLASEINRVVGEVNNVVITKDQFLKELDRLGVRPVPAKLAEFLREIQMRDKETVAKLQILEKEMELNTLCPVTNIGQENGIQESGEGSFHPDSEGIDEFLSLLRSIAEDLRLTGEINALCDGLTAVIDEIGYFFNELNVLVGSSVPDKMAEFMRGVQDKDIPNLMKMQILRREFELRAQEKNLFIEKLKGNMYF